MANIFICGDTGHAALLDRVAEALRAKGHTVVRGPMDVPGTLRHYSPAECQQFLGSADIAVFTTRHSCSKGLMAHAPRLRGICFPVIGVETLDLDAANELGLAVGHGAVRENVVGMAEATLMLMLMLLYRVEANIKLLTMRRWRPPFPIAQQLEGKTVGIIGFGRIGSELASRLLVFGARILACSPRVSQDALPAGVTKTDLPNLLRNCHIISVLTGLTPETRGMIGEAELALMRPDAFLVNTSRGAICDERALYLALRDRKIAGAALDTFTTEPLPADNPLRELDNVILTPHAVGHTEEGAHAFAPAMLENIDRLLAGDLPLYCKNPGVESAWRARLARLEHESPGTRRK